MYTFSVLGTSGTLYYALFRIQRRLRAWLFIAAVTLLPSIGLAQTSYTWTGTAGSAWNNAANWSPNTGFPLAADHATIVAAANAPVLDANRTITNLTLTSGTLDLAGRVLTFTGTGNFNGGAVNNGTLTANNTAATLTFAGTSFGASITGTT
ncbi:MAG TPA: hypothetical protein VHL57_06050, partial [Flavobacteriales bacterium]|nr:hypothetical protein [Flavobacteriales bacterium]